MYMNENTETLIDACEEIGLDENTDNAKYMQLCRYQILGQNNDPKMANIHFENVVSFKYFEMTKTDQNLIENEIKRRLISDNTCKLSTKIRRRLAWSLHKDSCDVIINILTVIFLGININAINIITSKYNYTS